MPLGDVTLRFHVQEELFWSRRAEHQSQSARIVRMGSMHQLWGLLHVLHALLVTRKIQSSAISHHYQMVRSFVSSVVRYMRSLDCTQRNLFCLRYRCLGGTSLEPCGAGRYSRLGDGACTSCERGRYVTRVAQGSCALCPPGCVCLVDYVIIRNSSDRYACADAASSPNPCSPGSYALGAAANCSACPAGWYHTHYSQLSSFHFACAGHMCTSRWTEPQPCESGSYALYNWGYCMVCPAGYFCYTTTDEPNPCPAGSSSIRGSTTCAACKTGIHMCVRVLVVTASRFGNRGNCK